MEGDRPDLVCRRSPDLQQACEAGQAGRAVGVSIGGSGDRFLGHAKRRLQIGRNRSLVMPPPQETRQRGKARGPLRIPGLHERERRLGQGDRTVKVRPVSQGAVPSPSLTECNREIANARRPFQSGLRGGGERFLRVGDGLVEVFRSAAPGEARPEALR